MNRVQQRVYEILEVGKGSDVLSKLCDRFLMILVLASILDVILGSVPEIDEMYGEDLRLFEIFTVALLITSSLMYFIENNAQPEVFRSIPDALWWSLITLTTVGYGDVSPVTLLGKIVGAVTAMMGVCTVALLTGIVGNAFSAQLANKRSVFRSEIMKALRDGVITHDEQEELDRLRDHFNMSKQHAQSIFDETLEDMGLDPSGYSKL